MGIKIHRRDCKFIVKPEDRMVVCIIEGDHIANMLLDYIDEIGGDSIEVWPIGRKMRGQLTLPRSFVGKAVCAEGDTWNEELGRKLAYSRAKNKLYTSFFKRANTFVNELDYKISRMITGLNNFGAKLDDQRIGLEQSIDEMLQKE